MHSSKTLHFAIKECFAMMFNKVLRKALVRAQIVQAPNYSYRVSHVDRCNRIVAFRKLRPDSQSQNMEIIALYELVHFLFLLIIPHSSLYELSYCSS